LRDALAGDLSTIVSKCLRPRPLDRYLSLETLMDDLRRYLEGRPVLARPQTTWYRVGKFVRRNRKAVAGASLLLVLLLCSVGYAAWQQERALEEARRAVRMQNFLYKLFRLANSNYTGKRSTTVPEFLQLGVRMLPQYISNPADLRTAQMSLAESMLENEDLDGARPVFEQTVESARAAGDTNAQAESEAFLGQIAYLQGDNDDGARLTADALALSQKPGVTPAVRVWSAMYFAANRDKLGFRSDENVRLLRFAVKESLDKGLPPHQTADAMFDLAEDLEQFGGLDEAESLFRQGLKVYGDDPSVLCDRSRILGELANVQVLRGDIAGSVPTYKQAWDGASACSGPQSRQALTQEEEYVDVIAKTGRAEEARTMMIESMPAWRKLEGHNPDLGKPLYFLAEVNLASGHFEDAAAAVEEAVRIQTGKIEPADRRFGVLHLIWAHALAGEHRPAEALVHAEIASKLLVGAISPGAKKKDEEARQLLAELKAGAGR
jgi:serine/threonine-protein kinase